jgi:thiol-disulfide isomerase/thioredoxin
MIWVNRRKFLILGGTALALFPRRAAAATPFSAAAFADAQAADKAILVEVSAPWCPVCKVQKPILARLLADPRFAEYVQFEIDFDTRKDALRTVNARVQSTLIVFRGKDEIGRSLGDTNPASIENLLSMAL